MKKISVNTNANVSEPRFECPIQDRNFQPATFNFQLSEVPPARPAFSLSNTDGFWELTFYSHRAILPQNQALFYIAWLLDHPAPAAIPGYNLGIQVLEQFGEHEDFDFSRGSAPIFFEETVVAAIFRKRKQALEAILDDPDQSDPVKHEALRELVVVNDRLAADKEEIVHAAEETARLLANNLQQLYCTLISAVDARGNPQPVLRAFGRHLLLYVIIPSNQASALAGVTCFVYRPERGNVDVKG